MIQSELLLEYQWNKVNTISTYKVALSISSDANSAALLPMSVHVSHTDITELSSWCDSSSRN